MKNILITGASGGMGKVATNYLADQGMHIYALDIKPLEEAENVTSFICDLTKKDEVKRVKEELKNIKLDAIIHLVGTYKMDSLIEIPEESFRKIFDINFHSIYLVNKYFFELLNPNSKIVMISSELAPLDPLPFNGLYSLTKSLLEQYAVSLRQELNLLGHQVIIVRPGAIATGMIDESVTSVKEMVKDTKLYQEYVANFCKIVEANESKTVEPIKIAKLINKVLRKKKPKLLYSLNRNPKLILLSMLPKRTQLWIIKKMLGKKEKQR